MKLAIIPGRGGSKRIPRKNIREFAGKPLIAHPIGAALRSGLFDRVVVSTDDEEIAGIARDSGAEVPFLRPAELADDFTGTIEVIAHAVQQLRDASTAAPSAVCCIYPTAPFVQVDDLRKGLTLLESESWQYVFSATSYSSSIFRSFSRAADGGLQMFFPDRFSTRTQDLPDALHDAAQFYWGRPEAWLGRERIYDSHSTVVQIPRWRVQDIDTEEDWLRAELVSAWLNSPDQRPGGLPVQ
ncbi:MAG: pseudaminic acid cytidylyltransferase [Pseudomonadota bacterium]